MRAHGSTAATPSSNLSSPKLDLMPWCRQGAHQMRSETSCATTLQRHQARALTSIQQVRGHLCLGLLRQARLKPLVRTAELRLRIARLSLGGAPFRCQRVHRCQDTWQGLHMLSGAATSKGCDMFGMVLRMTSCAATVQACGTRRQRCRQLRGG